LDRAKRCLREVRLLRHFGRHHHVVGMIDMIEPTSKDDFEDLYLVMEYMETDLYVIDPHHSFDLSLIAVTHLLCLNE
jgi:serine/threonine protein kinase